jgi:hypothetical protein
VPDANRPSRGHGAPGIQLGVPGVAVEQLPEQLDGARLGPRLQVLGHQGEALPVALVLQLGRRRSGRDGRATQARPWSPGRRALRAMRRRPAVAIAGVLGAALLSVVPASIAWVQAAERRAVEDAAEDLRGALALAESERERANRNLDQASEAIETLLVEAGDRLLTGIPMMRRVQRELLERALVLVEGLQPEVADDPRQRHRAARLHHVTARMCLDLGERERAGEAVAAGLELFIGLDPSPEVEALAFELNRQRVDLLSREDGAAALAAADALLARRPAVPPESWLAAELFRASLEFGQGRPESAREHLDAAIVEAREHAGGDRDLRRQLARLLGERGTQAYKFGQLESAVVDLQAADEIMAGLAAEDPEWLRPRLDGLALRNNLFSTLEGLDRSAEADAVLAGAREESARLVQLFPSSPIFATRHAGILANLGFLAAKRGDLGTAEALTRETVELCRAHLDSEQLGIELLNHATQSLQNLAGLALKAGRYADTLEASREAETLLEAGLALAPGDLNLRRIRLHLRVLRAYAAMATGDGALADAVLDAAERDAPEHPEALRLLTQVLVERSEQLEPGAARDALHARALAVLVRAVDAGYANTADLERTTLLNPLRELDGYPSAADR